MPLWAAVPILSVNDLPAALDEYQRVFGFQKSWVWGDPPELASVCRDLGEPTESVRAPRPSANDLEVFVPAKDFALSKRFYTALGFHPNWEEGDIAEFELGGVRFLLQNLYEPTWAGYFMFHVRVDEAAAWRRHAEAVIASGEYPGAKVEGPRDESFGFRVTYVWDPSRVLLHFAEPIPGKM